MRAKPVTVSFFRIALVTAIAVHLLSAAAHVYFGGMNVDEGFYAVAARAVMQGEVPYRDFGYTQTPLLPYVNGSVLALTGYGLFEQRWLNGAWGAGALLLTAVWVGRRTRPAIGLALAAVFSLSPAWMYFIHLGKTYGFTSLIAVLATLVFVRQPGGWKKQWLLGLLGVVGVGCRLPAAPFFAVLWLAALGQARGPWWRTVLVAVVGLVVAGAALLLPFYLLAPENTRFWVFDFHRVSVPRKNWHLAWEGAATLAPVWWVVLATVGGIVAVTRRFRGSRETMVALAALVALAANLLPRGVYEEYGIPFLLPLAGALSCELFQLAVGWHPWAKVVLLTALAAAHVALAPIITRHAGVRYRPGVVAAWLPPNAPAYDPELPAHLGQARRIIATLLPADQPLLGPHLILAAETGRAVPRKLRMGAFSMTMDFPAEKADRLNLLTYPELLAYFSSGDVPLIAFSTQSLLNYSWSMPSLRIPPLAERMRWREIFHRDFLVVFEGSTFWILARRTALPAGTVVRPGG